MKRLINDSSFSLVQYLSIVCCHVNWISSLFSVLFSPYFSAKLEQVLAMFPYTAQNSDELTFYKGSVINVVSKEGEWWKGEMNGQTGMFPSNYVQPLSDLKMGTTQCKSGVEAVIWVDLFQLLRYSRSSRKRPPRKFEKVVVTRAGRSREWAQ